MGPKHNLKNHNKNNLSLSLTSFTLDIVNISLSFGQFYQGWWWETGNLLALPKASPPHLGHSTNLESFSMFNQTSQNILFNEKFYKKPLSFSYLCYQQWSYICRWIRGEIANNCLRHCFLALPWGKLWRNFGSALVCPEYKVISDRLPPNTP